MARDYKREYALRKEKDYGGWRTLGASVPSTLAEDFKAKCSLDDTTPNAIMRAFIQAYVNNEFTFDGESIKAQKQGG